MPSESSSSAQTEKPHHYTYLKEFRTQQCPLFLQHKCTQHRPFTCFHWHFMNQRRRRPVRKKDGTFNYSPDVYCTKYDETTGICPEGDECPFLHRTAGDTERRYHLRYYKTSVCVHETDSKGYCVKNGPHCAFAHGAQDLRPPVYDIRELSPPEGQIEIIDTPLASSVEKDRLINEDPRWNDTNYVLTNYKTEQCKRPPRLCRQGYACPSYHNTRDRRRSPKKFKYRSTPCPNVKHGDDWGDPSQCDSGENCQYCHTRTEQQFHPEIYKSTKCNDMVQTGYCPRGPFCAFAHVEQEMTTHRDMPTPTDNSLAAFLTNVLPETATKTDTNGDQASEEQTANGDNSDMKHLINNIKAHVSQMNHNPLPLGLARTLSVDAGEVRILASTSMPQPIGKGRTHSLASSMGSDSLFNSYGRAPGSEREDQVNQLNLRKAYLQALENSPNLDAADKNKYKHGLLLRSSRTNNGNHGQLSPSSGPSSVPASIGATFPFPLSTMSPNALSFYPPRDTVESVVGTALEEDLNLGELGLTCIDRELARDDNDTNSVCSSMSAGLPSTGGYIGASSVPVTIPSGGPTGYNRSNFSSLSQSMSPTASPSDSLHHNFLSSLHQKPDHVYDATALAFLSQPNPGKYAAPGFTESNLSNMSPSSISQSPLLGSGSHFTSSSVGEATRLQEEIVQLKSKLAQWQDGVSQARGACEAWKKEADEANKRSKVSDEEKLKVIKQRDEALKQTAKLKVELDKARGGPHLHYLQKISELDTLPVPHLQHLQAQLRLDLDSLEKAIFQRSNVQQTGGMVCNVCQEKRNNLAVLPCSHYVMCDTCASKNMECPCCHQKIHRPGLIPM